MVRLDFQHIREVMHHDVHRVTLAGRRGDQCHVGTGVRSKLSPAECMRASRDGQATTSGNPEVAATPSGDAGVGELVPAETKLIPPALARHFGIVEALLVAANEASNRSSDGSDKGGSGPGTADKLDSLGGLTPLGDADPAYAAPTHAPRRQEGGNRRRPSERGVPAGASLNRQLGVVVAHGCG
jgi:hypothetical protein